jgi:hypothetical protein
MYKELFALDGLLEPISIPSVLAENLGYNLVPTIGLSNSLVTLCFINTFVAAAKFLGNKLPGYSSEPFQILSLNS